MKCLRIKTIPLKESKCSRSQEFILCRPNIKGSSFIASLKTADISLLSCDTAAQRVSEHAYQYIATVQISAVLRIEYKNLNIHNKL